MLFSVHGVLTSFANLASTVSLSWKLMGCFLGCFYCLDNKARGALTMDGAISIRGMNIGLQKALEAIPNILNE